MINEIWKKIINKKIIYLIYNFDINNKIIINMKLLIKELDYISPSITFYHNSQLSHSSIISGIVSIISILFIMAYPIPLILSPKKNQVKWGKW